MHENLATATTCPTCRSADVDVAVLGMPFPTMGQYQAAHDALSRQITEAAFPDRPWLADVDEYDGDESMALEFWMDAEEGRGLCAPGNRYRLFGCVIDEWMLQMPGCTCRTCGHQWDEPDDEDLEFDDADGDVVESDVPHELS